MIDGYFITSHVHDPEAAPSSGDVPLMIGQTGTEFPLFMLGDEAAYSMDETGLEQRVAGAFGGQDALKVLISCRRDFRTMMPRARGSAFSPTTPWAR